MITVTSPALGTENRTASTGLDGRYEIKDLPAGRYTIRVQRSGYLGLQYGQRRPLEAGKPLQIADQQTADSIDFVLPRTGVILGRVTDELGDPIAGVNVYALRSVWFEGRRRLARAGGPNVITDEDGEYRMVGLNPATYYLMAVSNDTWTQSAGDRQEVMGYAPTYHPGTANISEARAVAVGVGQRMTSVDVALAPGRAARISGTARDSQGRPLQTVHLEQSFRGPSGASFRTAGNATAAADGSFTIRNIPPGEYALNASANGSAETIRQPIVVNGDDIDGITLTATSGWRMSGHLIAEDGTAPPIARDRLRVTGRMISWPFGLGVPGPRNPSDDVVVGDWTFKTMPLFGAAQIRVAGLPDGWGVKAIDREGRDITDTIVELGSGEELGGVQNRTDRQALDGFGPVGRSEGGSAHGRNGSRVRRGSAAVDGRLPLGRVGASRPGWQLSIPRPAARRVSGSRTRVRRGRLLERSRLSRVNPSSRRPLRARGSRHPRAFAENGDAVSPDGFPATICRGGR